MSRRTLGRFLLAGIAGYFLAISALVCAGLKDNLHRADVALVLGNKVNLDGSLSPRLQARVDESLRLYRLGYFAQIVVSGGPGEGRDEATAMKAYLVARGVPPDAVIADSLGINTYASAKNIRDLLAQEGLSSVMVITQYYHVPRTRLALRRFGVTTIYSSHARYFEWGDLYAVQREIAGYLRYATRTYD